MGYPLPRLSRLQGTDAYTPAALSPGNGVAERSYSTAEPDHQSFDQPLKGDNSGFVTERDERIPFSTLSALEAVVTSTHGSQAAQAFKGNKGLKSLPPAQGQTPPGLDGCLGPHASDSRC